MNTLASVCARDIQTDDLMREGVFAILGGDHVVMFKDGSMLLDAHKDEITVTEVMARHGYTRYALINAGAEMTFWNLRHGLPSELFVRENGKSYHVVMFTGWESENGNQMRQHPRFLEVEDVTKVVQACNEAEEISDEDLEAVEGF
jgi:hypothetical protein